MQIEPMPVFILPSIQCNVNKPMSGVIFKSSSKVSSSRNLLTTICFSQIGGLVMGWCYFPLLSRSLRCGLLPLPLGSPERLREPFSADTDNLRYKTDLSGTPWIVPVGPRNRHTTLGPRGGQKSPGSMLTASKGGAVTWSVPEKKPLSTQVLSSSR